MMEMPFFIQTSEIGTIITITVLLLIMSHIQPNKVFLVFEAFWRKLTKKLYLRTKK